MNATPAASATTSAQHPPPIWRASDEGVYECIGICLADPATGLCEGCGRPLAEPQSQWVDDDAATSSPSSSASTTS